MHNQERREKLKTAHRPSLTSAQRVDRLPVAEARATVEKLGGDPQLVVRSEASLTAQP